jgi:hypothetical protein
LFFRESFASKLAPTGASRQCNLEISAKGEQ